MSKFYYCIKNVSVGPINELFFGSECCCCYYLKLKINPDMCDRVCKDRK